MVIFRCETCGSFNLNQNHCRDCFRTRFDGEGNFRLFRRPENGLITRCNKCEEFDTTKCFWIDLSSNEICCDIICSRCEYRGTIFTGEYFVQDTEQDRYNGFIDIFSDLQYMTEPAWYHLIPHREMPRHMLGEDDEDDYYTGRNDDDDD